MQQRLGRVGCFVGVREVYGRLWESIRRIVVGKDEVVDLCLISLLAGARLAHGHPRRGQDDAGKGDLPVYRGGLLAHPVHPGPAAQRLTGMGINEPRKPRFQWLTEPVPRSPPNSAPPNV